LRVEAERQRRSAEAMLRLWLISPRDPEDQPQPALAERDQLEDILPLSASPSEVPDLAGRIQQALSLRAELDVARLEVQVRHAQGELLRRSRVPNLALSFTAQSDGFGERVLGGGISLPLPLPEPLGPSRGGEVAAAAIAVEQAKTEVETRRRQVKQEVELALQAVQAAQRALSQVPAELIARTQTDLWAIAEAIRGGRVSLREALLWQRGLLELLQLHLRVRRDYALARIELQRASGLPLLLAAPGASAAQPAQTVEESR
jgi:outer membrane protein, heavy metal efflux system